MPVQQTEITATTIAADELHRQWRETYQVQNGEGAERWKPMKPASVEWVAQHGDIPPSAIRQGANGPEINIAALPNSSLPPQFSGENTASAEGAIRAISENKGADIDKLAAIVHEQWLKRNGSWASDELKKPYAELPEIEKQKDRNVIEAAKKAIQRASFTTDATDAAVKLGVSRENAEQGTHIALEAGDQATRHYHTVEHFANLEAGASALQTTLAAKGFSPATAEFVTNAYRVAARDHDTVYTTADGKIPPEIERTIGQYIEPAQGGGYQIKATASGTNIEIAMDAFGYKPGQKLNPFSGQNEFLSAVHSLEINNAMPPDAKVAVAGMIQSTIPFDKADSVNTMMERVRGLSKFLGPEREAAVGLASATLANNDVATFDPAVGTREAFRGNSLDLLREGGVNFNEPASVIAKANGMSGFFENVLQKGIDSGKQAIFRDYIDPNDPSIRLMSEAELATKNTRANVQIRDSIRDMRAVAAAAGEDMAHGRSSTFDGLMERARQIKAENTPEAIAAIAADSAKLAKGEITPEAMQTRLNEIEQQNASGRGGVEPSEAAKPPIEPQRSAQQQGQWELLEASKRNPDGSVRNVARLRMLPENTNEWAAIAKDPEIKSRVVHKEGKPFLEVQPEYVDTLHAKYPGTTPGATSVTPATPSPHGQSEPTAPVAETPRPPVAGALEAENVGTRAAAAGLGVSGYYLADALVRGDKNAALQASGGVLVSGAVLGDTALATAGRSSGFVSGALGHTVIPVVVVTEGVSVAGILAENKLDSKQHVTEHVATTTVAVGAGIGGIAALGTSALATGGTALIAAGAAAATAYAMNKIDKATYGAEDIRFSPNLVSKSHMVALSVKFEDQLADPKTGKVDLNDMPTLNKLATLEQNEVYKQEQIVRDNSSWVPRWIRHGEGVYNQENARAAMNVAESAKTETHERMNEVLQMQQVTEVAQAKINTLLHKPNVAQERDAILNRAYNGQYANAEQKQKDITRLGEMLGEDANAPVKIDNHALAGNLIGQVEKAGAAERAKQQSVTHGRSLNSNNVGHTTPHDTQPQVHLAAVPSVAQNQVAQR